MITFTTEQLAIIGKLKDLKPWFFEENQPFLYYASDLLENGALPSTLAKSLLAFTQYVKEGHRPELVEDALKILNRLVQPYELKLVKPELEMFAENRHYRWEELGNFVDAESVITHVVNKVVVVLNLGKF